MKLKKYTGGDILRVTIIHCASACKRLIYDFETQEATIITDGSSILNGLKRLRDLKQADKKRHSDAGGAECLGLRSGR